jgi:hypothetical protein
MTKLTAIKAFQRKIDAYCELRLSTAFSSDEAEALKAYMRRLIERRCAPPRTAGRTEWGAVASMTGIDALASHHRLIDPAFDAIVRWKRDGGKKSWSDPRGLPETWRRNEGKKRQRRENDTDNQVGASENCASTGWPCGAYVWREGRVSGTFVSRVG